MRWKRIEPTDRARIQPKRSGAAVARTSNGRRQRLPLAAVHLRAECVEVRAAAGGAVRRGPPRRNPTHGEARLRCVKFRVVLRLAAAASAARHRSHVTRAGLT
jgi:hypothetical protein